jgi:hypothetical protein
MLLSMTLCEGQKPKGDPLEHEPLQQRRHLTTTPFSTAFPKLSALPFRVLIHFRTHLLSTTTSPRILHRNDRCNDALAA